MKLELRTTVCGRVNVSSLLLFSQLVLLYSLLYSVLSTNDTVIIGLFLITRYIETSLLLWALTMTQQYGKQKFQLRRRKLPGGKLCGRCVNLTIKKITKIATSITNTAIFSLKLVMLIEWRRSRHYFLPRNRFHK